MGYASGFTHGAESDETSDGFMETFVIFASRSASVEAFRRQADGQVTPVESFDLELRASWDEPVARGPIPHAELLTLSELGAHAGVPVDTAIARLEARGLGSHPPDTVLRDIAREVRLSAQQVLRNNRRAKPAWSWTGTRPGCAGSQGHRSGRWIGTVNPGPALLR
jgi:hypothetical protein